MSVQEMSWNANCHYNSFYSLPLGIVAIVTAVYAKNVKCFILHKQTSTERKNCYRTTTIIKSINTEKKGLQTVIDMQYHMYCSPDP